MPTDWTSAIAILASGLIVGLIIVLYNRRRNASSPIATTESELRDLHAKRDALVGQLRDLDENASAEERQRLEHQAADVLRRIDAHGAVASSAAAAEGARSGNAMNPVMKGYLWGFASALALAGLGYFVMQTATPREDGGIVTGGIETMSDRPVQAPTNDPMVLQLEAAVKRDPENLQLRNDLAQAYLERENLMGVFEQTAFVLEKRPEDSRALTFQGLVRLAMGETDAAVDMMQRAAKSDPANLDSWVSLAWVYAQTDRMADAQKMIAEAKKRSPKDVARLDAVFAQMQQHLADAKTAQPAGELPPDHPPVAAGAVAPSPLSPAAAAAGDRAITVTLDIDPSATRKTGTLFVMARGAAAGPPVAVKRLQVSSFPVTFQLGAADSMMGQPLPDRFRLEARLDADGDAMTKTPADPSAMQTDVTIGSNVRLALK